MNSEVAQKARKLIEREQNKDSVVTEVITDDSRTINIKPKVNTE